VRYSAAIVLVVAGFTWVAEPLTGQAYVGWFAAAALGLGLAHAARAGDWGWSSAALLPGLAGQRFGYPGEAGDHEDDGSGVAHWCEPSRQAGVAALLAVSK
jgi:hypothetical protein